MWKFLLWVGISAFLTPHSQDFSKLKNSAWNLILIPWEKLNFHQMELQEFLGLNSMRQNLIFESSKLNLTPALKSWFIFIPFSITQKTLKTNNEYENPTFPLFILDLGKFLGQKKNFKNRWKNSQNFLCVSKKFQVFLLKL